MMRDEAHAMLDEARRILDAAGWTNDGERRGCGYWFVLGRRGDLMRITLEWSGRWDATVMISALELAHQWSSTDPAALIERTTQAARTVLLAQIAALPLLDSIDAP